jgi:2-methylcitrate dehydratase PrpD
MGFTGPTRIYEFHDGGVLKAFSDASDPGQLTAELGNSYRLDANCIKPYSCCGSTHSYVDAAFELRRRLGTPWNPTRRVRAGLAEVVELQCGFDYLPSSALNAQMSLRYIVAAALLEGQVLPPQFAEAKLSDPAITALAQSLELERDPALDKFYPERFAAWLAAQDNNGAWQRVDVLDPLGSVANPVGERGIIEKFRGLNPHLPVDTIADAVLNIERCTVREVLNLLAGEHARQRLTA